MPTTNEPAPPLPREPFTEVALPNEPKSDVKLVLTSDGTALRERMVRVNSDETGGYTLVFTSTKLDATDKVTSDPSPRIEMAFTGEQLSRLGSTTAIAAAILKRREEAAAIARDHFRGLELGEQVIASRLGE